MATTWDFSGQGKVYEVNSSGVHRFMLNVASLQISMNVDTAERKESQSGQRLTAVQIVTGKKVEFKMTLNEWSKDNLALAMYGESISQVSGSVTGEVLNADFDQGGRWSLANQKVSSVVVKDSLNATVNSNLYKVDADYGAIEVASGADFSAYTGPYTMSYSYATRNEVGMFTKSIPERLLRFEGLNTARDNEPVLVEIYRVQFNPMSGIDLITDDFAKMELSGKALVDSNRSADAALGQFGKIVLLG